MSKCLTYYVIHDVTRQWKAVISYTLVKFTQLLHDWCAADVVKPCVLRIWNANSKRHHQCQQRQCHHHRHRRFYIHCILPTEKPLVVNTIKKKLFMINRAVFIESNINIYKYHFLKLFLFYMQWQYDHLKLLFPHLIFMINIQPIVCDYKAKKLIICLA